ncbi:MAG: GDP-mannose 4,6-dehydratase [Sphingobacteriales bacterium]|nr:GDP-mannose 4,6-dehydratase [Sphingobacteriales bacterium]
MKAIIFGASGQDGFYLTQLLAQQDVSVIGVSRSGGFLNIDISDFGQVGDLVKKYRPDYIFHLAANSTTRHDAIFENHETIATGTLNILEAVKQYVPETKVFISGSGLQFENKGEPIKETDPFEARDAYSISRIQSVYAARYFRRLGLKVYVGYFFNHDSPRRTERHMAQKIASAAKRIAKGSEEKLVIGDLSVVKEWAFAGDVVKGIWLLVNQDVVTEANIGSGKGYSILDWVELCFGIAGKGYQQFVQTEEGFKAEYRQLVCNNHRLLSLGFQHEVSFEALAAMMMHE